MAPEPTYDGRERIERARRPELVSAYQGLRDVVFARDSAIPYQLKREVFTISSIAAGCTHCQAHGSYSLHEEGVDDQRIQALWDFDTSPRVTEAERAAFRFARDAGLAPNATTAAHHVELRAHYSDEQIAEILAVISLGGWLNRWHDSLATVTDEKSASWADEHLAPVGWERGRHAPGTQTVWILAGARRECPVHHEALQEGAVGLARHDGGRIVFEGTPADLVAARSTLTGEYLAACVGS